MATEKEMDSTVDIIPVGRIELESTHSTMISLESIRNGEAGLNARRQSILNRAPEIGDFAGFKLGFLELKDLAYLTAKTGHEFAILRSKDTDYLFHGDERRCSFPVSISELLVAHKLEIVGHSHPGEDDPLPSKGDRMTLKRIKQKQSCIVSGRTGRMTVFGPDEFEVLDDFL